MDWGRHAKLVEEVLTLMRLGNLLRPVELPVATACIRDFEKAKEAAWRKWAGRTGKNWTDIRENEAGAHWGVISRARNQKQVSSELDRTLEEAFQTVTSMMPREYLSIIDDVVGDLNEILVNRYVYGLDWKRRLLKGRPFAPDFYQRLFDYYRAGWWPCGWEGEYPRGEMLAYCPPLATEKTLLPNKIVAGP